MNTMRDIQGLRARALSLGDMVTVAICDIALGCDVTYLYDELDMTESQRAHDDLRLIDGSQQAAQEWCEETLAHEVST